MSRHVDDRTMDSFFGSENSSWKNGVGPLLKNQTLDASVRRGPHELELYESVRGVSPETDVIFPST